ncbi:putative receptor-like protein kinase At3g47110 [Lactuca sativa]|uniref:putative receptor-like protein kinase At3g47110 n=1 Tax=Lactuca sativa TaxID=4236 RepID=UPI0022AFA708|nr:putative receptor-like protein kinase At3g47110 [Lactuca sativa]
MTGPLPPSISNCSKLRFLEVNYNNFSGKLKIDFAKVKDIYFVSLGNNIYGFGEADDMKFIDTLKNCSRIKVLHLSNCNFQGVLPTSIGNLSDQISILTLDRNDFHGNLPSSIGNLVGLIGFSLTENRFTGKIPSAIGNIPSSIGGCTSLLFLSLKGNTFQSMGDVPVVGVFANASAFSVFGNSRLCGGLTELGLLKCNTKKHKKRFPLFEIVILISFTLFSILCIVYACKKRKGQVSHSQSLRDKRFMQVSYSQLLKATNGFSQANLISEGGFSSVYKGILNRNDRFVAVKVIHLQNRGAHKSFIAECEAWRSIRHRNILKIITSCSSVDFQGNDFKALVYEFMPNGSLHDWLHSSVSKSRLNLLQRINILIDIASAHDYLHNHCLPTIVHCDLKPSNVLLDDDMVAHVGDFGLAQFPGINSNQKNTSGIRGTIGYAPPGEALSWYKYLTTNQLLTNWTEFCRAMELQFGPSSYENHQASLFKLKQTSIVAAYQAEFEKISNCVDGLTLVSIRNCFKSGLHNDVQNEIALHHPISPSSLWSC